MELTEKQTEALDFLEDDATLEVLYGGGAGGGKSVLGCYWLLKNALKYPQSRYLMGRATASTLRQTTLNTFWYVCRMQGVPSDWIVYNESKGVLNIVPTSSEIILKHLQYRPADPNFDELGSLEITGAFIDECNQISAKAWNVVRSRIRYRLKDFSLIPKMLGTCNPSKGFVYSRFYKPWKEGSLDSEKRFVPSLLKDNPYISEHYEKSLKGLDERSRERLLCGEWEYDADPFALITYDRILDAFTAVSVKDDSQRYITADIARFGDDSTVVCLWYGLRCEKISVYPKSSVDTSADIILRLCHTANVPLSHVVCDEDGVGGGVVDILHCKGFVNNSHPVAVGGVPQNYQNLKCQCYFMLSQKIQNGEIFLNVTDAVLKNRIVEELQQVRAVDNAGGGALAVVSKSRVKEALGRSPDVADAIMMRMFFCLRGTGNKNLENFF
ncbi:MAG: phage terminase large subunit [Flavobacteriales bacterium]|nr:phage terminase large subunit [Flavobacteriales bacterium]